MRGRACCIAKPADRQRRFPAVAPAAQSTPARPAMQHVVVTKVRAISPAAETRLASLRRGADGAELAPQEVGRLGQPRCECDSRPNEEPATPASRFPNGNAMMPPAVRDPADVQDRRCPHAAGPAGGRTSPAAQASRSRSNIRKNRDAAASVAIRDHDVGPAISAERRRRSVRAHRVDRTRRPNDSGTSERWRYRLREFHISRRGSQMLVPATADGRRPAAPGCG